MVIFNATALIFCGFKKIQGFLIWGFSIYRFPYAILTYSQAILNLSLGQYKIVFYQVDQQTTNHIVESVLCSRNVHTTDDVWTRDKMATVCVEAESRQAV